MRKRWNIAAAVAVSAVLVCPTVQARADSGVSLNQRMITAEQVGLRGLQGSGPSLVSGDAYSGYCTGNPRRHSVLLNGLHTGGKTSTSVVEFGFQFPTSTAAAAFLAQLRSSSRLCLTKNARFGAPKASVAVRVISAPVVAGASHSFGVVYTTHSTTVEAKTRQTTVKNIATRLNTYQVGRYVVVTEVAKSTVTTVGSRTTIVVRDDAATRALGAKVARIAVADVLSGEATPAGS